MDNVMGDSLELIKEMHRKMLDDNEYFELYAKNCGKIYDALFNVGFCHQSALQLTVALVNKGSS